jgi:hypothetical protein
MTFGSFKITPVEVRKVTDEVGFGVFASGSISGGAEVYKDIPIVSIQHTANRRFIQACQHCHRQVGSIRHKIERILSEPRFQGLDLSRLPSMTEDIYYCECGETYCSHSCAQIALKNHHYCLCVSRTGENGQAVADFKYYCLSIEGCGDNLLLLAQLLGVAASRADGSYPTFESVLKDLLTYTNRPFNEVARPPEGSERDEEWNEWLESTISEAFELLSRALAPQNPIFSKFFAEKHSAFSILSRLLSAFELNNIDIAIPSSLSSELNSLLAQGIDVVAIIREKEVAMRMLWDDEARGIYEDEFEDEEMDAEEEDDRDDGSENSCTAHHGEEYIDEMILKIREEVAKMSIEELTASEYPTFHGTGLFASVARTNHSCEPNVVMDFYDSNAMVTCKALRDVHQGEELRMSYIGRPESKSTKVRQAQLRDYLFECSCQKCSHNE